MIYSPDPIVITGLAYEAHASDYAQARADRSRIQPSIQRFASLLKPSALVLDSGCGPGVDSGSLAQHWLQPVAMDIAQAMALLANRQMPGSAVRGDSRQLPFATDSFDGVWANLSLLHLPKDQVNEAILEIRRVLRSGGIFFAGLQIGADDAIETGRPGSSMSAPRFYARYQLDEWTQHLKRAGLEVIDAEESWSALRTFAKKP